LNDSKSKPSTKYLNERALRQVAAHAGVDVALVNRYFGSKQGLFAAIITTEAFTFEPFMAIGKAGFAEGLARH
jgi:AcrR family transcriptional regulator